MEHEEKVFFLLSFRRDSTQQLSLPVSYSTTRELARERKEAATAALRISIL
jgi:hypothetical protein